MNRPRPEPMQIVKQRRDAALNALVDSVPYIRFLNISFDRRGDELTGQMNFGEKLIGNPLLPALHGGATAAFLEMTAMMALNWQHVWAKIEAGELDPADMAAGNLPRQPKTIDFTVDYLRSGLPRDAYARAVVARSGRRFASVRVEAWQDNKDKPFAQAVGHFLMPQGEDKRDTKQT